MTKSWRPKEWLTPHEYVRTPSFLELAVAQDTDTIKFYQNEFYELGADAMLEALKKQHPCFVDEKGVASIHFPLGKAKGYFVFIEEKE